MNDDRIAEELLLRDTFEITLMVDINTAHGMSDETLARVLGQAAVAALHEHMDDED